MQSLSKRKDNVIGKKRGSAREKGKERGNGRDKEKGRGKENARDRGNEKGRQKKNGNQYHNPPLVPLGQRQEKSSAVGPSIGTHNRRTDIRTDSD